MKIINLSYKASPAYSDTGQWIAGYDFFYRIWEVLAQQHEVIFLEFINAETNILNKGISFLFQRETKVSLLFPFRLNRFIAAQRPDVVVVHGIMYPLQVWLLRKALGDQVRIIVQHHAERPLSGWRRLLQPRADRVTDAYWFTARGLAEMWMGERLIRRDAKVFEIMETTSVFRVADRDAAKAVTGVHGDGIYLWVGRLNDNKDPLLLVRTFISFARDTPGARLYMIYQNDDLLNNIQALLAQHAEPATSIYLVGKVPHDQLQHWYNSADFIVSCSHYEGSGVAICEAMSCGCIPLVTDIPSFSYMTGKACGKSFPVGDEAALRSVLDSTSTLDIALERGRTLQQYHRYLSPEAIAARIQEVLGAV